VDGGDLVFLLDLMRLTQISVLLIFAVGALHAAPISLIPGSIIVEQPGQPFTTSNLQAYSNGGSLLGTGQVSGANQIVHGLAVLNGNLFLGDGAGDIDHVDLSSGTVTSFFATGSAVGGLGTLNGNLLTFNPFSPSGAAFNVYSTSGTLLQSIALGTIPSFTLGPVASDGTSIYLADEFSGLIYKYSMAGALLGSFDTQTGTGFNAGLNGLAYSAANNSLWISDDKTNQLIDLSTSGTHLSAFSTGSFDPSNLAVDFTSAPEPRYTIVLFIALALAIPARNGFCVPIRRGR
jgi:hypothetical protein